MSRKRKFEEDDMAFEVEQAKMVMVEEAEEGRLKHICNRHTLRPLHNPVPNLWEGDNGMMEHLRRNFPMPKLITDENSAGTSNEVEITKVEQHKNKIDSLESNSSKSPQKEKSDCVIDLTDSPAKESKPSENISKDSQVPECKLTESVEGKILSEQSVNQNPKDVSKEPEDVILIAETENVKTDCMDEINYWKHLYVLHDELISIQNEQYTCGEYLMDYSNKPHSQKDLLLSQEKLDMINSDIKITLEKAAPLEYSSYVPQHVKEQLSRNFNLTTDQLKMLSKEVSDSMTEKVFKKDGLKTHLSIENASDELLYWQTLTSILSDTQSLLKCKKSPKKDQLEYLEFRRLKRKYLDKVFISTMKAGDRNNFNEEMPSEIRNALNCSKSLSHKLIRSHLKKLKTSIKKESYKAAGKVSTESVEAEILADQSVNQNSEDESEEPEDVILITETENIKTDCMDEISHWKHLYELHDKLISIQKEQYTCGEYLMDYSNKPQSQKDLLLSQENLDMINSDIKITLKKAALLKYTSYVPPHVKEQLNRNFNLTTDQLKMLSKEVSDSMTEKIFKKDGLETYLNIENASDELLYWQTLTSIYSDTKSLMKCTKSPKRDRLEYIELKRLKSNSLHKVFISTVKAKDRCKFDKEMSLEIKNTLNCSMTLSHTKIRRDLKHLMLNIKKATLKFSALAEVGKVNGDGLKGNSVTKKQKKKDVKRTQVRKNKRLKNKLNEFLSNINNKVNEDKQAPAPVP